VKQVITIIPTKPEFDSKISEILQKTEYKHLRGGIRDFIERIREAIKEWLIKMLQNTFSNLSEVPSISDKLSTAFIILGMLILLAIIISIVVKTSKAFHKKERIKEILGERIDQRTTPQSLRQKAADFEQSGDFRLAVRYDFIALLLLMHENSLLYLDETKTNEEIYNYLRENSFSRLQLFRSLINIFNSTWYGHKLYSKSMYDQWKVELNLLWSEVIKYEEAGK
jgi:hypothetical protein